MSNTRSEIVVDNIIELRKLDRAECLRLLAEQNIGRVVCTDAAMPAALPVNYRLVGGEVIFRVGRDGQLAAATRNNVVGFEVDEIDARTHTGWSVLGIGEAYEILDRKRLSGLASTVPEPWPTYRSTSTIAVPLRVISGRRLAMASWVSNALCGEAI
ncbi:pyridoxamine 5'-phosphate oxidase family protein [Pseudonocardia eucalypti]|uniref:Pyridoxamine 5'-phosphate oxidase family protein n=1 Tax=Pseudonocardia eucalypti TaxID=648755 RepID=A0ABP9QI79_9PSEU|nr:nitroimidazol reductase NimA-like FMN-containing flavoprotein (pyridoxamine 5'-phosphate oxidase superfamily) [Pseudonocardia eucalypti]